MNEWQVSYGTLFEEALERNMAQHGVNSASLSVGSVFALQEALLKSVNIGTLGTMTRSIYGTGASFVIGGGSEGALIGSLGGLATGILVTAAGVALLGASTPALIGVAVASGLTSTAAGVLFQSLYEAYDRYSNSNAAAPKPSEALPSDAFNFDRGLVLDTIVIESGAQNNPVTQMYGILSEMQSLVNDWNSNYASRGVSISINDFLKNDASGWADKLADIAGSNLLMRERGLEIAEKLQKLGQDAKDLNDAKKDEIKDLDPDFADKLGQLFDSVNGFNDMMNEYSTPLVINLSGNGIQTIGIHDSHAHFDFGYENEVAHSWVSSESGFLVLDKNGNGVVDNITELFGSKEKDGFSILAQYDTNGDGVINSDDAIFSQLNIWRDLNGDGKTDAGELISLADAEVKTISLKPTLQNINDNGNWIPLTSQVTMTDGSTREIADVYLQRVRTEVDTAIDIVSDSYVVMGTSLSDRLEGTTKDQVFLGGLGADTFVFRDNFGDDIVADFDPIGNYHDTIEIHQDGWTSFQDALDNMYQEGSDVVISVSGDCSIRILDTNITTITNENMKIIPV